MNAPKVNLLCRYPVIAGHELKRSDWSDEQNKAAFGKCVNPHGHNYQIELWLTGSVNVETGLLINGYDVDGIVQPFLETYMDHKFLNKDVAFFREHQPTVEWIAVWLYEELKAQFPKHVTLNKVRVFETENLAVEYP